MINKGDELLKTIPDFTSWNEAQKWIDQGRKIFHKHIPSTILKSEILSLEWSEIEIKDKSPFGLFSVENWRKFVLAVFFADLISYMEPVDQVSFDRLLFVMHGFPQGFRTWWIKLSDGTWLPVGYTGWYPMLETAFEILEKDPHKIADRTIVPNKFQKESKPYLYLFNYSLAAQFKKSDLSKMLMQKFAEDVLRQEASGIACIAVSEDGVRVANRFGMKCSGHFTIEDSIENVFVKRFSRLECA